MRATVQRAVCLAASALVLAAVSPATAQLSVIDRRCIETVAKSGRKLATGALKLLTRCRERELTSGACPVPPIGPLDRLRDRLFENIERGCPPSNLASVEFLRGVCLDATPGDPFTVDDLKECIFSSHLAIDEGLLDFLYDPMLAGPLGGEDVACLRSAARQGTRVLDCVLQRVQRCRNAINRGALLGVRPDGCATDDPPSRDAIARCEGSAEAAIDRHCTDPQLANLGICPILPVATSRAGCIVERFHLAADDPSPTSPPDLIDFEYGDGPVPPLCGDGVVDALDEECDGADDAACPGECGSATTPDGYFACLCKTEPRQRVVEHANADLDEGWTGWGHDGAVVEGSGYVADLSDCDGSGTCIVGPSCALFPHSPCGVPAEAPPGTSGDAICAALGEGACRKERTAVGPHCLLDLQKKCNPKAAFDPACGSPGDTCVKTLHGPPRPVAAGGVAVCVVGVFSEDVVGTTNLLTGEGAVRLREVSRMHSSVGSANQPCPVCGGFCAGNRERCTSDPDCHAGEGPCVTADVCSNGPNRDRPCRTASPFGAATALFGTTSVDCPPFPGSDLSSGGLDVLQSPRTTGTVTLMPGYPCTSFAFQGNACLGGSSEGRPCADPSDCPGGSCSSRCFCPGQAAPNDCDSAPEPPAPRGARVGAYRASDAIWGFPGPGALTQPETVVVVP